MRTTRPCVLTVTMIVMSLTLVGCGGGGTANPRAEGSPEASLPTLADLPAGYGLGDDGGCGALGAEGADEALLRLEQAAATIVPVCGREFSWRWTAYPAAMPMSISVHVLTWPTAALAVDAMSALPSWAGWVGREVVPTSEIADKALGEQANAVVGVDDGQATGSTTAGVAWRSGARTGLVVAVASTRETAHSAALRLAGIVEERRAAGTAAPAGSMDDRTVPLDDPALTTVVWWLGERWTPPPPLPQLTLARSFTHIGRLEGSGPGNTVDMDYTADRVALTLLNWTPGQWDTFARTRLGRLATRPACSTTTTARIADWDVTLLTMRFRTGQRGAPEPVDCDPEGPSTSSWAIARRADAIVTVNMPICLYCYGPRAPEDSFNSPEALSAVIAGLTPRR